jgi:hypothetical protein
VRRQARYSLTYLLASFLFLWLFQVLILGPLFNRTTEIAYSAFKAKLADHQIDNVIIGERSVEGTMKMKKPDGSLASVPFNSPFIHESDPGLIQDLQAAGVSFGTQLTSEAVEAPWAAFLE